MKMRSTPKAKLDINTEMPLQLILANSIEKHVVNTADSNTLNMPREKRKEDARKPLYLKRV
jgi:hypothetical protein